MTDDGNSVACSECGAAHDIGEIEVAYGLLDDYFMLSREQREARGRANSDFCQLDNRFFVRSVIPVPLPEPDRYYCWGVWVELPRENCRIAYDTWEDEDVSRIPRLKGKLANGLREYENSKGLLGELELRPDSHPFFYIVEESRLMHDLHSGITAEDAVRYYHQIA